MDKLLLLSGVLCVSCVTAQSTLPGMCIQATSHRATLVNPTQHQSVFYSGSFQRDCISSSLPKMLWHLTNPLFEGHLASLFTLLRSKRFNCVSVEMGPLGPYCMGILSVYAVLSLAQQLWSVPRSPMASHRGCQPASVIREDHRVRR